MKSERRLIDVDEALEKLRQVEPSLKVVSVVGLKAVPIDAVIQFLERRKTVDAVEVVHGEWVIERSPVEAEFKCSECDYLYIDADSYAKEKYNYCPNCGAKMDGERKEKDA